ncbi:MAG TPA: amidohydrolase family protein [Longimicrobiales bacterium]|nr:amidohydrolase family protein [Longimicrobiales bacterium]
MSRNNERSGSRTGALLAALALAASALGAPAAAHAQTLAVRGGTVHAMAGEPYVGTVVMENGRITAAGPSAAVPAGATVIDATGLHVYPGLFDAGTQLGLTEVGAVDVTNDIDELGDYTPHLLARTAVHPASEHIPVARANGITHALTLPMGGRGGGSGGFPGQGSVLSLDGWTVEEMDIEPASVMVLDWPTIRTGGRPAWLGGGGERSFEDAREDYERAVAQLTQWLDAARSYARSVEGGATIPRDLRLEALARVTRGELPVLARVEAERDIRNVVEFAQAQGLRLILAGASEGYRVADLLAARGIPVILGPTQAMPRGEDRGYDEAYANPGLLHAAGVTIAFATFNSSDSRTLPYEAAMGIPFGLPRDVALRAITVTPARILGLAERLGTVQPGRLGNLIVTDGDPLEITTRVRHLIVEGREVPTLNRHRDLYERYRSRPGMPKR